MIRVRRPVMTQYQERQHLAQAVWLPILPATEHDSSVTTRRRDVELEHPLLNRLEESLVMPDDNTTLLLSEIIDPYIREALVEFSGDPKHIGSGVEKDVPDFVLCVRVDQDAPIQEPV